MRRGQHGQGRTTDHRRDAKGTAVIDITSSRTATTKLPASKSALIIITRLMSITGALKAVGIVVVTIRSRPMSLQMGSNPQVTIVEELEVLMVALEDTKRTPQFIRHQLPNIRNPK